MADGEWLHSNTIFKNMSLEEYLNHILVKYLET